MDNNELLQQVIAVIQEQTESISEIMDKKITESETRINIKLENQVSKRIEAIEHKLGIAM